MSSMLFDILKDTTMDSLRTLPFLFLAFLMIETLEKYSGDFTERMMRKVGMAGPLVGALVGCIPQCGFSVLAANLYAGGILSVGTLIAVFMATSDEAILIIMSHPEYLGTVGKLLFYKVLLALISGYAIHLFFRPVLEVPKHKRELCDECGYEEEESGVLKPAWHHTWKIFLYLFVFTFALNLLIEVLGVSRLSAILLGDTVFQPLIAAVIGLIPNCAGSVILTQLYLNGAISFPSVITGLCAGTGVGILVLFRVNKHKKENMKILGALFLISVIAGIFVEIIGKFVII